MRWRVPNIWQDGECWILGGGNSMPRQFDVPQGLIDEVVAGRQLPSCYSPFFEKIHNRHVIAVNQSFRIGDWVDLLFFGDNNFYVENTNDILSFNKIKVSSHTAFAKHPKIKYLARDKQPQGISNDPSTVCWNANSGAAAISIAANMGCKRIVLLGFDMQRIEGEKHWHGLYKSKIKKGKKRKNDNVFGRHLIGFDQIAKDADRRGIEILNCSPNSAIHQFKKVEVNHIL